MSKDLSPLQKALQKARNKSSSADFGGLDYDIVIPLEYVEKILQEMEIDMINEFAAKINSKEYY